MNVLVQQAIERFLETFEQINPDAVYPSDMRDAIIGYVEEAGSQPKLLLDRNKCIQTLIDGGCDPEEAEEYFEFNTLGSYLGDVQPVFATLIGGDDDDDKGIQDFSPEVDTPETTPEEVSDVRPRLLAV